MTEQKKTRAPGAGVKADDGVATERKQVRLDAASEAVLLKVGGGNLSLGIREATRQAMPPALENCLKASMDVQYGSLAGQWMKVVSRASSGDSGRR